MKPLVIDGCVTQGDWSSWAVTSPDGLYRYALGRNWDPDPGTGLWSGLWGSSRPTLVATLLNPSKARHDVDDPTLRKLVHFAKQEGCGGLFLRNLAAWSSSDPAELATVADPFGPHNDTVLRICPDFATHLVAWGAISSPRIRKRLVHSIATIKTVPMRWLLCLGVTKSGEPKHPLYLPNATRMVSWATALEQQAKGV